MPFRTVARAFGRYPRTLRHRALIGAVGVAALAGAAPTLAAAYNPDALAPAQLSRIDELCRAVVGLERGEARYFACAGSLSNSARHLGSGALSSSLASATGPEPGLRKSYPYASSGELRHREALSCGGLGLDEGDQAFTQCENNLDAALFNADNPMQ
jgi:hypothetical protein